LRHPPRRCGPRKSRSYQFRANLLNQFAENTSEACRRRLRAVKLQLPRNETRLKICSQVARSFGRDYRRRLKLSWLLILSMVLVDYLGFDRLGNPRRCRFDGDAASLEGARR
jgi:hypothetical protein